MEYDGCYMLTNETFSKNSLYQVVFQILLGWTKRFILPLANVVFKAFNCLQLDNTHRLYSWEGVWSLGNPGKVCGYRAAIATLSPPIVGSGVAWEDGAGADPPPTLLPGKNLPPVRSSFPTSQLDAPANVCIMP